MRVSSPTELRPRIEEAWSIHPFSSPSNQSRTCNRALYYARSIGIFRLRTPQHTIETFQQCPPRERRDPQRRKPT